MILRPQKRGFGILCRRNFAQTTSLFIVAWLLFLPTIRTPRPSDFSKMPTRQRLPAGSCLPWRQQLWWINIWVLRLTLMSWCADVVQDEKRATVQNQIKERVKVNRCRDLMVVNDLLSFVQMTCMRTVGPSHWLHLDIDYIPRWLPRFVFVYIDANVIMPMRFDAAVAATMMELRQCACGSACLFLNIVMASANAWGFVSSAENYTFHCLGQAQASLAVCIFNCNEACSSCPVSIILFELLLWLTPSSPSRQLEWCWCLHTFWLLSDLKFYSQNWKAWLCFESHHGRGLSGHPRRISKWKWNF